MRRMIRIGSALMIAVGLLVGSVAITHAQAGTAAAPAAKTDAAPQNSVTSTGTGTAAGYVGWNYMHVNNCWSYYDGTYSYLYVYDPYTILTAVTPAYVQTIQPACQSGNWIAYYNYYCSSGTCYWFQVYTYNYK